jgi:hypothetical protein
VIRLAFSGLITNTNPWLSRFYLHYSGTAPTVAQLTTFLGVVDTSWSTNVRPVYVNNRDLLQIEAIDLSSPTGAVSILPVSHTGTRAGGDLPGQICSVTSYEIARRYRGGHPRGYWPFGSPTDLQTEVQWTNAFITAVNTALNALVASCVGGGWTGAGTITQCNVSYYSGFTVVVSPTTGRARNVPTLRVSPTIDTVTALKTQTSIGTQRRRAAFID